MDDSSDSLVRGRTRWRRFAAVMVPVFAIMGLMVYMVASGSLAVSFAISNQTFQVDADSLTSTATDTNGIGFYQFGIVNFQGNGTPVPQVESVIPAASLTNLCQSVSTTTPLGTLTLRITAGDAGTPATATNLLTDNSTLAATSASFQNIHIGQDMSQFGNLSAPVARGTGPNVTTAPLPAGTFGQDATGVTLTGLRSVSSGTSASSFTLPNLHLSLTAGTASACPP